MKQYLDFNIDRIIKTVSGDIDSDLAKSGVFYRLQYRSKSMKSLDKKLSKLNENGISKYNENKKLRDLLGIRVILYFQDDLKLIVDHFKKKLRDYFVEETIDPYSNSEFKPTRINLIYSLNDNFTKEFMEIVKDPRIDNTFELQFRTIFSEGWHEIEHDFRYKCPNLWLKFPEYDRMLNAFLASLETTEWSMLQLFEKKMYDHYKEKEIEALISLKLRIRFENTEISNELERIILDNPELLKDLYLIDRKVVILQIISCNSFPKSIDNVVYFINFFYLNNALIMNLMDSVLIDIFSSIKRCK